MYFIIGASVAANEVDFISVVPSTNAAAAHEVTLQNYQKEFNLPTSRHIYTKTLHKTEDHKQALDIYDKLMARLGE